ncbi:MAG: prolyl oligopeptidase family serine peptidase [Porticoccaceae bacterium]|nr:prolyl oligopeptidase family serine peptidase [Porticoccaceae bacterium]
MKTRLSAFIFLPSLLIGLMLVASTALAKLPGEGQSILELRRSEFSNLSVSPSGKYISIVMRRDDRNTLVIMDRATGKLIPGKSVRYDKRDNMEVQGGQWISDEIFYYSVYVDDGKYRPGYNGDIFLLHMNKDVNERVWHWTGSYEKRLKKGGNLIRGNLRIISRLPLDDENVLVSVYPWKRRDGGVRPIIYKMNLFNGNFNKVKVGPARGADIMSNKNGTSLVGIAPAPEVGSIFYYYNAGDENWGDITVDFPGSFSPRKVSDDGKFVYGLTQLEKGINASQSLVKVSLDSGEYEVIHNFGFVSQISIGFTERGGHPEYATWVDDKPQIKVFKKTRPAQVLAGFAKGFPGYLVVNTGSDDAEENITLYVGSPGIKGEYYIWEKSTGSARYLFSQQEAVDQLGLNSFESIKYTASDGAQLQGWLLMPRSGKPKALINHIHGGPHGPYNRYVFDTEMQILAEMGYAVFAPNFRGSGGYGKNLERAGYRQWGTRMLDDMREGAEFVQENYDVGDKVYTMGGSYGGYASAQNIVRHNDYYDCSVIVAGFFEFDELTATWDGRRGFNTNDFTNTTMGTDAARLRAMSPIHNLDKVKVPILIIHGKADRRTPLAGAKKYVKALKKTNIDFKHHFYSNEGHGLYFDDNSLDQYEKINTFLNQCDARPPLNVASR